MSKKSAPTPAATAAVVASEAAVSPHGSAPAAAAAAIDELTESGLRRLAPFVFTLTTENRDHVDTTPVQDLVAREEGFAEHYFVVDRVEAVTWFCGLPMDAILTPFHHLVADIKAAQGVLADPEAVAFSVAQSHLVAVCIQQKIASIAQTREKRRLAILEAEHQAHVELVEKYLEDGLSADAAEAAAIAEEEAAKRAEEQGGAGGDGEDEDAAAKRTEAVVCLRGFPLQASDIMALHKVGTIVNAVVSVNSTARLGMRKEDKAAMAAAAAAQAAAAGSKGGAKGAAADPKAKPDPKKAAAPGGKKGAEETVVVQVDALSISLKKELAKLPPLSAHPLLDVALWEYTAAVTVTSTSTEAAGSEGKQVELVEPEGAILHLVAQRVVSMENMFRRYGQWSANKSGRIVPPLLLRDTQREEAEALAAAALAKEKAEAAAKTNAGGKKPAAAPAVPPKAGGAAGKGDASSGAATSGDLATKESDALMAIPVATVLAPLPKSVSAIKDHSPSTTQAPSSCNLKGSALFVSAVNELVNDATAAANNNSSIVAHTTTSTEGSICLTPQATPRSAANEVLEKAIKQAKEDVSDFCDYMLATLDGTQMQVVESIRLRREREKGTTLTAVTTGAASLRKSEKARVALGSEELDVEEVPDCPIRVSTEIVDSLFAPRGGAQKGDDANDEDHNGQLSLDRIVDGVAKCIGCTREEAFALIESRLSMAEVLNEEQVKERLLSLCRSGDGGPSDSTHVPLSKGSAASLYVSQAAPVPADKHRSLMSWHAFHGSGTFAQYVQWSDYVASEELYYYPPPRDEDDEAEDAAREAAVEEEEEEEEDDQEEEALDDEGNVIEVKKKRREKKIILYDPEYVNVAEERKAALRRRQMFDLFRRILTSSSEGSDDEWLLANNHTAHVAHEDMDFLYPDDGCVIASRRDRMNTVSTSCTVHCPGAPLGSRCFGFRTTAAAGGNAADGDASRVESGVRGFLSVHGVTVTFSSCVQDPASISTVGTAMDVSAPVLLTQNVVATSSGSNMPSPTKTPRGNSAAKEKETTPREASVTAASAAAPRPTSASTKPRLPTAVLRESPLLDTVITNFDEVSIQIPHDTPVMHLRPIEPVALYSTRERPSVAVYHPATLSVIRQPVAVELYRSVSVAGSVSVAYKVDPIPTSSISSATAEETLQLQMFPDGSMASFHRGYCLLTKSDGSRLVRDMASGTTTMLSGLEVATTREDDALRTVRLREDGTVFYDLDHGVSCVCFPDGTIFETRADVNLKTATKGSAYALQLPRGHPLLITSPSPYPVLSVRNKEVSLFNAEQSVAVIWKERETLTLSAIDSGLQAVVPLYQPHFLYVLPTATKAHQYVIDLLFGGLRVEDDAWCFHVTPNGNCRARLQAEEHAPAPTDFTVKHRLEVFAPTREIVSARFASIMGERFVSLFSPIQLRAMPPRLHSDMIKQHVHLLPKEPLTTAQDAKSRRFAKDIHQFAAPATAVAAFDTPRIVLRLGDGSGIELLRNQDRDYLCRSLVALSDLNMSCLSRSGTQTTLLSARKPSHQHFIDKELQDRVCRNTDVRYPAFLSEGRTLDQFRTLVSSATGKESDEVHSQRHTVSMRRKLILRHFYSSTTGSSMTGHDMALPSTYTIESLDHALHHLIASLPLSDRARLSAAAEPLPSSPNGFSPTTSTTTQAPRAPLHNHLEALNERLNGLRQSAPRFWKDPTTEVSAADLQEAKDRVHAVIEAKKAACEAVTNRSKDDAAAATTTSAAAGARSTIHVNPPTLGSSTALPLQSTTSRRLAAFRLVVTPTAIDFGVLMSGFRYCATVQLTNVATTACRFRVECPSEMRWLSVEYPRLPVAAGMSVPVVFEVNGYQPVGSSMTVACAVTYEGGNSLSIPITLSTRSPDERPVSQQRQGVRLIGPSRLNYVPGSTTTILPSTAGVDEDDD